MEQADLNTWEEFEAEISKLYHKRAQRAAATTLHVSQYVFRGLSDSAWALTTTLERYTQSLLTLREYYRLVHASKPQVETFTGADWRIPSIEDYVKWMESTGGLLLAENVPAYEYFVYLRHHGFPSPLLDWTQSPYVAAHFAFCDPESQAERVAIYAYCEYTAGGKSGSSKKPQIVGLGHHVRSHRRHFQQQSEYTFCVVLRGDGLAYASHEDAFAGVVEDQDELWKFTIPSSERPKVLKQLERHNINAFSLFGSEESLMETVALRLFYLRNFDKLP